MKMFKVEYVSKKILNCTSFMQSFNKIYLVTVLYQTIYRSYLLHRCWRNGNKHALPVVKFKI